MANDLSMACSPSTLSMAAACPQGTAAVDVKPGRETGLRGDKALGVSNEITKQLIHRPEGRSLAESRLCGGNGLFTGDNKTGNISTLRYMSLGRGRFDDLMMSTGG